MESIQSVALTAFTGRKLKHLKKRFVIISDMLHNTSEFSHYTGELDFDKIHRSPYYLKVRANLEGIDVIIFYVRRETPRKIQGRRHIEFWQQYFLDQSAVVKRVLRIEG